MWHLRLFTFFGLLSLIFAHPLETSLARNIVKNTNQISKDTSLNPRNDVFKLQNRGPNVYSQKHIKILRAASETILRYLEEGDVVFFVGNSGSYMMLPFDNSVIKKFNMKAIPYSYDGSQPKAKGLTDYWNNIAGPSLSGKNIIKKPPVYLKEFKRIILVGHSVTGKSIDQFQDLLVSACEYGVTSKYGGVVGKQIKEQLSKVPIFLINVFDVRDQVSVKEPEHVTVLREMMAGRNGDINSMLGGVEYPKILPEYPPSKWEKSPDDCWTSDEKKKSKLFKENVIAWNKDKKNGGLVREPKSKRGLGMV